MQIAPLSDALGAEVIDLDVSRELDADVVDTLRRAFHEHHLLCIRSQPLNPLEFARIGRYFGTPQLQLLRQQRTDEAAEVSVLESTYKSEDAKPADLTQVRLSGWHTDDSYFATPAKATMLQALAIPDSGGQTKFANTSKAYRDLPDEKKRALDDLRGVHAYDTIRATARAQNRTQEEQAETPDVIHPLIRTHEETGRKAIYYNPNRTDRIEGMARAESDALLDELYAIITLPRYQYHHEWRLGDILLWNNRCLIHAVNTDFPAGQERRHQRILLKGVVPN